MLPRITWHLLPCFCLLLTGCLEEAGDSDPPVQGEIRTLQIDGEPLRYQVRGPLAVYQDHIILGSASEPLDPRIDYWPDGTLPYTISEEFPREERVRVWRLLKRARQHFRDLTGVELIPRTDQADYVVIRPLGRHQACGAAHLGRVGGAQPLHFAAYCGFGTLLHHLGHTLGMVHEHTRRDRDQFVEVRWKNLLAGEDYLFDRVPHRLDDIGEYDYWSIMHGWAGDESAQRCTEADDTGCVMVSRKGQHHFEMGQRNGLSRGDAQTLCELYGNPTGLVLSVPDGPRIDLNEDVTLRAKVGTPLQLAAQLRWRWARDPGFIRIASDRQGELADRLYLPGTVDRLIELTGLDRGLHVISVETLQHCPTRFDFRVDVR